MNRTTDSKRRRAPSLRKALEALYEWVEGNVAYGTPANIAAKVDAALEAGPSATDRWHIRDTDPLTVHDENGLFVGAFNVPEDAALAALAPGMHAALSEIITKGRAHGLTKSQMLDIAANAITAGER